MGPSTRGSAGARDPRENGHLLAGRPPQRRTANVSPAPVGASHAASSSATCAAGGPRRHQATSVSTPARGPSATTSTDPSGRFRTEPDETEPGRLPCRRLAVEHPLDPSGDAQADPDPGPVSATHGAPTSSRRRNSASPTVFTPSARAFSAFEPASSPATTRSVLRETLPETFPPSLDLRLGLVPRELREPPGEHHGLPGEDPAPRRLLRRRADTRLDQPRHDAPVLGLVDPGPESPGPSPARRRGRRAGRPRWRRGSAPG